MTVQVFIAQDVFAKKPWKRHKTRNVAALLQRELGPWPEGARLYHRSVTKANEIILQDESDCAALAKMPGPFYVAVYPRDPFTALIISIALTSVAVLATVLLLPSIPNVNQQAGSTNNSLTGRKNQARLLARIPDIGGEVRAVPDLLGFPYRTFVDNVEIETSYMCVGRGSYDVGDARDDQTLISEIEGTSVAVYGPGTSPNSGDDPQLLIGDAIPDPVLTVLTSTAVNGQTLYAPDYKYVEGDGHIRFNSDGTIESNDSSDINFTRYFEAGDTIDVALAFDGGLDYSGTYPVLDVEPRFIYLDDPGSINSDWIGAPGHSSYTSATIDGFRASKKIGPFVLDLADCDRIITNLIAQGGLYRANDDGQEPVEVTVDIGITALDEDLEIAGPETLYTITMRGSAVTREQVATTLQQMMFFVGPASITAQRTSPGDYQYSGTVVDEVKWRDLYAAAPVAQTDFGNVTTVHARTIATKTATSLKERKLNMLVCRKLPARDGDGFTETLTATKNAADIFCAFALDPYLGRRSLSEINVAQIYDTVAAVQAYLGYAEACEFGYSFDDDQTSAEEMLTAIAAVIFCTAVRRSGKLELVFERQTADSTLLFCHTNKVPGPERRVKRFGNLNNYDGVELTYVNGADYDNRATLVIPDDGSAANPKKIETVGVRHSEKATLIAHRAWQKIQYQREALEFQAMQEAACVAVSERIAVSNNIRPGTQDGEVVAISGLTLTLSQEVEMEEGQDYIILLQIPDGTIDAIAITAGENSKQVALAEPPSADLSTDLRNFARAAYWIVRDDEPASSQAFLVTEKSESDGFTYSISAANYDDRYYEHDQDFAS